MREITPECTLDYTVSKIERARQAKESYNTIIPIMAKFSDWSYTKSLKIAFIETAKKHKIPNTQPIYVSQMYPRAYGSDKTRQ